MHALEFLTIAEAARLIASRALSPLDLVRHLMRRIETVDPQLDCFITVTADHALAQAQSAEAEIMAGNYRGSLHGIPFGLKDIYDTAGILTSGHSRTAVNRVPSCDAAAVSALYQAGAILLGKLATHELALGGPSFDLPWPPARNPWDRTRFTGGSSSGSAAAVAAGLVPAALGSDTGGSIRTPAALCGVAGLKPTYGLVSSRGVIPNSFTLDHCGPIAWTAQDCAILLTALCGIDADDAASPRPSGHDYTAALDRPIKGLRIGILRHFFDALAPLHPEFEPAFNRAATTFTELGAIVEDARIDPPQAYHDVKIVIACSELTSIHRAGLVERIDDFGADFLGRVLPGLLFTAADYVGALRRRQELLARMLPTYHQFDLLLAPVSRGPAPPLAPNRTIEFWNRPNTTAAFSVTGGPALAFCIGFASNGLPLAAQLVGRPFDDATVLRAGHAYEQATPWRARRPLLTPKPRPEPTPVEPYRPEPALDSRTQSLADDLVARHGLTLSDAQRASLYEAAPYALAMAERVRGPYAWTTSPASRPVFPATDRGTAVRPPQAPR